MVEPLSKEDFLDKKQDYSPFLVHLTRDKTVYIEEYGEEIPFSAKEILDQILDEGTLRAFSYKYCLFGPSLDSQSKSLQDKFKVTCFTETPIDQIGVLLIEVSGRDIKLEPYGLVFKKEYIKQHGGNPVFYTTKEIAKPLWSLYWSLCNKKEESSKEECNLLALVTLFDERVDFHWEREWRIVGDLKFSPDDIYCGLCPEEDIPHFESNDSQLKFISPHWGINKILDKLVER